MDELSQTPTGARCPVCGTALPFQPHGPPFDAPCPHCRYTLWCYRTSGETVILRVVAGITPEHADVERLVGSLASVQSPPRVVLDMSDIELIGSALTARLIALNKHIRGAGGRLVLCGLHPFVRDTFHGSRLDRIFDVADDEQAARASL